MHCIILSWSVYDVVSTDLVYLRIDCHWYREKKRNGKKVIKQNTNSWVCVVVDKTNTFNTHEYTHARTHTHKHAHT